MMAVKNSSKEVLIDYRNNTSNSNAHQHFLWLKLFSDKPFSLEYQLQEVPSRHLEKEPIEVVKSHDSSTSERIDFSIEVASERLVLTSSTRNGKSNTSSHNPKQTTSKSGASVVPSTTLGMKYIRCSSEQKEKTKTKYFSARSRPGELKRQSMPFFLKEKVNLTCDKNLNSTWTDMLHNCFHPSSPTLSINEKESTDNHKKDFDNNNRTFMKSLHNFQHCGCPYEGGIDLCKECCNFWPYIEDHLREDIKCKKNICALWKLCLKKHQYRIFEFAPKGMVLLSYDEDKIGSITQDYEKYRIKPKIGMGGFGRVYQHFVSRGTSCSNIAVKEEKRSSCLIRDWKRFTSVKDLNHLNVLHFQEYVVGHHRDDHDKLTLLLVMEHYEQKGLNEPFRNEEKKCLLDYMSPASNNTKYIFRNLLVISLDLFKALKYFAKEKSLVHRDVKRSNILLKLKCSCPSAIECVCHGTDGRGGGTAILSDFDLVEEATSDDQWARLGDSEPAGTRGMKAPELFFVNENGEDTFTAKADIWSAFLTIMHVLLGRDMNDIPLQKITEFFKDTTSGIYDSLQEISSCIKDLETHCDSCEDQDHIITKNIKVLNNIKKSIEQLCRFQGGREKPSKISKKDRDNYCPAAELLTAVHGVSAMPQICISKVQHVFQSSNPLQESFRELWDIIQDGMCFRPKDRPDAEQVVDQLNDCLNKFLKSSLFN